MSIPSIISELVEKFELHKNSYTSGIYNEAQLRIEFIDPFFEALGWDINNRQGYAENYKEVIHEDAIKVGGVTKAPDYCFRIGGVRKFFLEAKKPSVDIKEAIHPAYQLRRYAWSAKLPLSILTDFEEFAIYDCRIKPSPTDKSSQARTLYLQYSDYINKWDDITNIFSKDAILKGSFDKYVKTTRGIKGTAEVDDAFLKEIESWRDILARNIAIRNPQLSQRELNSAVQQTIDRIIFLRICEDRGIENYGRLQALLNGTQIYNRLGELFRMADERYNSGLFYFRKESGRFGSPDELTLNLTIDDNTLKEIIKNLYYPDSPYEFSVLPAYILGYVYEQFLGKVIRLTAGHRAVVEEKPEVRKAGGVYYTPTYIVDYIVKNTVGKLVENKSPNEVEKLRILDPACGSGSFLLGAYQYLLDWHQNWYTKNNPEKWLKGRNPRLVERRKGDFRLTTPERKRILLNNIYGVDIDPQAVEVTKLSLLLKVLEGETEETIVNQLKLFHERALPDLANNIKCGNSLIGPDFYENQQMDLFNEEERYRINAFDWNTEFHEIMKNGGFDAVIGNPPYGFHQIHLPIIKSYFKMHYESSKGSFENYFLFYERSLNLLKIKGYHGFIVPVTWLTIPSALSLRKFILNNFFIGEIIWLSNLVFTDAKVNTLISIIIKQKHRKTKIIINESINQISSFAHTSYINQKDFIDSDYYIGIFDDSKDKNLINKIYANSMPLSNFARPCSGYNPYEVGKGEAPEGGLQTKDTVIKKPYHSERKLGPEWKKEIIGRDLQRYYLNTSGNRWVKYGSWLAAPRDPLNFLGKRIFVQEITGGTARRIVAAFFEGELYHSRDVIPIKCEKDFPHPCYLLGIINSSLMTWYHHHKNPKAKKELFPKVLVSDINKLPIHKIELSDQKDKKYYDKIISLVNHMISLKKQLSSSKTENEKTIINRQIEATDRQIDKLVYELYGLTEEEIKIIEKVK